MKQLLSGKFLAPAVLTIILTVIFWTNFTPGTYLIGWDNLLPELNIWLNLKRSFFAVWQEYQGLGLVGGMAHATDLIRQLILLPFILTLPSNLIRYIWHFAMVALGSFGVYRGLLGLKLNRLTSLCGSVFYLLNFGTIQYFWAPLETFSAFWGYFPWLIFLLWEYLKTPDRSRLIKLSILNFLAIPGFYVQTLFFVYIIFVSLVLFSYFISGNGIWKTKITSILKIVLIIFALNSFWLLPQFYFLNTNLTNPAAGIGNYMANEDTFNRNERRGYFGDLLILRGYYYDFPSNHGPLMGPWISHFSNIYILGCGYLLSVFAIFGLVLLFVKSQPSNLIRYSLLLFFLICSLALLSSTPPFSYTNSLIRSLPLINQIFRSPFTKFIVPSIFTYTLLVAFGINYLTKILPLIFPYSVFLFLMLIFSFPVFKGNFISPQFRQPLPAHYRELFKYFNSLPGTARIANLPQGSFWGWTNYNWGVSGSGFLWYGMPQAILDRAFDAWNLKNEQYYWELSTALQASDPNSLASVLKKYSIEYVIFDRSIYFPDDVVFDKLSVQSRQLLSITPGLSHTATIGPVEIYKFQLPTQPYSLTNPPSGNNFSFSYDDRIFDTLGDYTVSKSSDYRFPYVGLFTNRLQTEISPEINHFIARLDRSAELSKNHSTLPHPQLPDYFLQNKQGHSLLVFNYPEASLNQSYLVEVEYRHLSGKPLEISAVSENRLNYYFHTILDKSPDLTKAYFILPAHEKEDYNHGINIIFNNSSVNFRPSINIIKDIKMYPFPFSAYQSLHSPDALLTTDTKRTYLKSSSNIFFYKTTHFPAGATHLVLPQTFDNGWLAFYFDSVRPIFLQPHVLINNWANGWSLPQNFSGNIYIFFWPQLLEFFGLLLIPTAFIYILKTSHTPRK